MTTEDIIHLTEVDARSKSNTKRIDSLEKTLEEFHRLATSVEIIARELGHQTEAVGEIINLAFKTLQLHRIESYVMPRNTKSLRVMEKLGFMSEGLSKRCLEVDGVWEDHLRFSLLNE